MTLKSTVCLIAKNEARYLVEWIAYYRIIGFDEVIVYENNSTDESALLLGKLAASGKVTHRRWTLGKNRSPQITAYQDAFRKAQTEWILFVDADEFLVLHQHPTVNAFLQTFDARPDVTAIGVNWRIFGDSGNETYDSRPVVERFTKASAPDFVVNRHLKSFSKVKALRNMVHMHACDTSGEMVHPSGTSLSMKDWGLSDEIELDVAQVNHYYTKTVEEYQWKKQRGQGGAGEDRPDLKYWYNDQSFNGHNKNDFEDLAILKNFGPLVEEIRELQKIVDAS